MIEKRPSTPRAPRAKRPVHPVDVGNHLAQRRAVAALLDRQRMIIASRSFREGETRTRVLLAGEYYDVENWQLEQLQSGSTPGDLDLIPVPRED